MQFPIVHAQKGILTDVFVLILALYLYEASPPCIIVYAQNILTTVFVPISTPLTTLYTDRLTYINCCLSTLPDSCQSLRMNMLLKSALELIQSIRNTRNKLVHSS